MIAVAIVFVVGRRILERDHAIGVSAHDVRADLLEPAQHLARTRTVHAQIAGRDDAIGAALGGEIGQARLERDRVPVDVGEDRYPHA